MNIYTFYAHINSWNTQTGKQGKNVVPKLSESVVESKDLDVDFWLAIGVCCVLDCSLAP